MEFGRVSRIKYKFFNDSIVLFHSLKSHRCLSSHGYVYKFIRRKENEYRCCRCRELGKQRSITVVDHVVVGRKDPEDDHHPDCSPIPEQVITALEMDRKMRNEVGLLNFDDLAHKQYW